MRRFWYYITVAVLTFVLGIFTSLPFQRLVSVSNPAPVSVPPVMQPSVVGNRISLSCDDELLRQIATELLSDEDTAAHFMSYGIETFNCSDRFRVERVDFNHDGEPEIVVRGSGRYFCSPTGNCDFWIYRRTESGYEPLLLTGNVSQFYFYGTFSNGYRDIVTAMHGSAGDSDLSVYRFDGTQYRLVRCMSRSYSYIDRQGRFRETDRPIIRPRECQVEE